MTAAGRAEGRTRQRSNGRVDGRPARGTGLLAPGRFQMFQAPAGFLRMYMRRYRWGGRARGGSAFWVPLFFLFGVALGGRSIFLGLEARACDGLGIDARDGAALPGLFALPTFPDRAF